MSEFLLEPRTPSQDSASQRQGGYAALAVQDGSEPGSSPDGMAFEKDEKETNPLFDLPFFSVANIDEWYEAFTVRNTAAFVIQEAWHVAVFYSIYAGIVLWLAGKYPEIFQLFTAGAVLKVLAFMTGLLISFVLKESLERYRKCVSAMVDFTDEFKTLWYMSQQPLLRRLPPAKIITDMHMVLFVVSLVRFLMKKAGIELPNPDLVVQSEFRECLIFKDQAQYGAVSSNPAYAELLLVSWLRACGVLNGELRKHIEWTRQKLRTLITEQRVKSPGTAQHLLTVVTHMFLLWIPWCVEHDMSRIFLPLVAVVLFSLLKLAHELEDPFGVDRHDLPWPVMLANVSYCTLCQESTHYVKETVSAFNYACLHDEWKDAKSLFGQNYVSDMPMRGNKFDTGRLQLDLYLTLPKLKRLEVVSSELEEEPDALFGTETLKAGAMYKPRALDAGALKTSNSDSPWMSARSGSGTDRSCRADKPCCSIS